MKKEFLIPEVEVIELENCEIVVQTSGSVGGEDGGDGEGGEV